MGRRLRFNDYLKLAVLALARKPFDEGEDIYMVAPERGGQPHPYTVETPQRDNPTHFRIRVPLLYPDGTPYSGTPGYRLFTISVREELVR